MEAATIHANSSATSKARPAHKSKTRNSSKGAKPTTEQLPQLQSKSLHGGTVYLIKLESQLHSTTLTHNAPTTTQHVIIEGTRHMTNKQYSLLRGSLQAYVQLQLNQGRQVTLKLDGEGDMLRRITKWKEFQPTDNSTTTFSTALLQPLLLQSLFELGDHADLAIQQEGMVRKKAKKVEEGTDDCGDNVTSIDLPDTSELFQVPFGSQDAAATDIDSPAAYTATIKRIHDYRHSMTEEVFLTMPTTCKTMAEMNVYLSNARTGKHHDLVEIFGGLAGVSRVAIRRHLSTGENFDLTSGIDLSKRSERRELIKYLHKYRPMMAILAPPCTPFGPWSNLNRIINPESHAASLLWGIPLANLAATVARVQLDNGCHFMAENPWLSRMWHLPSWQVLLRDPRVFYCYLDQCAYKLKDAEGLLTKKPTAFVCSDEAFADELHKVCKCTQPHSQLVGTLQGQNKTAFAQVWPMDLCEAIVQAVINLRQRWQKQRSYPVVAEGAAPSVDNRPCAACKQHAARDDDRHNRGNKCKFPNDIGITWKCGACSKYQHVHHPGHSKVEGECRWATAPKRMTARRMWQKPEEEAPADIEELTEPPPSVQGTWEAVNSGSMLEILQRVKQREGWHQETYGPTHVAMDCAFLRTPEPRFIQASLPRRTVYGHFPEIMLATGGSGWFRLQNNVSSAQPANIGYPVPILAIMFHPDVSDGSSSIKNNGELRPSDSTELRWYDEGSDELDVRGVRGVPRRASNSSSSSASASNPLRELADKWAREEQEDDSYVREQLRQAQEKKKPFVPVGDPPPGQEGAEPEVPVQQEEEEAAPQQAEVPIVPDWSSFDLGRALRVLRSESPAHIVKTLQQLHLRWWHAKEYRMHSILHAAGVPEAVLKHIKGICESCRVCRMWSHTGRNAVATTRLSTEFNMVIQADLLFLGSVIILHIVDEATRLSGGGILRDKTAGELLRVLTMHWCRTWGPPRVLVADHESGLCGEEAAIFYERWGITFKPKPVGSHPYIVERHHAMVRSAWHHIQAQAKLDRLILTDEDVVSEIFYSKNAMLQIRGKSPYQAVIGRTPPCLTEFEQQGISAVDDHLGGVHSKHVTRLRELALQSIVAATAQDRVQRALTTQTRVSGEVMDYRTGESVDIFRQPASKEQSGWRGPCEIVSVANVSDGYIEVKYHGRALSVRIQDIRRALVYVTLLDDDYPQLRTLQQHILEMKPGSFQTFAVVHDVKGWVLSKMAREKPQIFRAGLFVGVNTFHLRCLGVRLGSCSDSGLPGMTLTGQCVFMWYPKTEPAAYRTLTHEGSDRLNFKQIMGSEFQDMHWMQFIGGNDADSDDVRTAVPDEPMLAENPDQGPATAAVAPPAWTWRTEPPDYDMKLDSDQEDDDMMPQVPPYHPPWKPQRYDINTPRSRTPVSTNNSTRKAVSTSQSINTDTTANTLPSGWQREHNAPMLMPKRLPGPTRGTTQHGGASASTDVGPNAHQPELPINDPDDEGMANDDDDDDQATIDWRDGDDIAELFATTTLVPPVFGGCSNCNNIDDQVQDQQMYLAEQVQTEVKPDTSDVEDNSAIEIELPYYMARLTKEFEHIKPDEILIYVINKKKGIVKKMIKKSYDALTPQDIKENAAMVREACLAEVRAFQDNKTYEVADKSSCSNVCTSRWVLRWKLVDGKRIVKARLTIRGFQDMQDNMSTYASTASRWTQRLVLSVAVQRLWRLFVADISTAFLQGMSFTELAKLEGSAERDVAFTPPKGSEDLFVEVEKGRYNPWKHALRMLKAVYGLRDAPKAWRTRLCQVLAESGGRPCFSDPSLWVWHSGGELTALISIHVDDLKGCGHDGQVTKILNLLASAFGKLKTSYRQFEHCGIKHEQSEDNATIRIHQNHYVVQLQRMETANAAAEAALTTVQESDFLSLLGGLSWLIQTRLDIAIFVCSLQRAAKRPLGEHATRINKVLRWATRNPAFLTYRRMATPCSVATISDSAFRKECEQGLAMRGAVIGLSPTQLEVPSGIIHIIEFYARKQRRVTRSTFSAELNAFVDAIEFARLVAMVLTEVVTPQVSAMALRRLEEVGDLHCKIVGVVDAQSVFDALAAPEIRPPSESSLIMLLCGVKESLRTGLMSRIFWIDTSDMLADGLGKGMVSRQALLLVGNTGEWHVQYMPKGFSEAIKTVIPSA